MIGIVSYGAHIPIWRLTREKIATQWGQPPAPGERSVAGFDEDSITMSVAAAMNCFKGMDRSKVGALYFCSTTAPYQEKQSGTVVATATDLRTDLTVVDFANSLRAGTQALRTAFHSIGAESEKQILVAAADTRPAAPQSQSEKYFGDGAAAVLLGNANVLAEIEWSHTVFQEITDTWREEGGAFVSMWEDRFSLEQGYLKMAATVVPDALKKFNATPQDYSKIIFNAPDARKQGQIAKMLGFDVKTRIQGGYYDTAGFMGSAHPLIMLIGALETANPEDRLLMVSYGNGIDVMSLRVTDQIKNHKDRSGVKKGLARRLMLPDYGTYAKWKGIVNPDAGVRRPAREVPSASAQFREQNQNLRFHGVQCNHCNTVQYPIQRVCTKCQTKDDFTKVRLSDKKSTLFTYAFDYIAGTPDTPCVVCMINFEGGGRMMCTMTDRNIESIEIDMPLEMTFRKLFTLGGIHTYFWKCMPSQDD